MGPAKCRMEEMLFSRSKSAALDPTGQWDLGECSSQGCQLGALTACKLFSGPLQSPQRKLHCPSWAGDEDAGRAVTLILCVQSGTHSEVKGLNGTRTLNYVDRNIETVRGKHAVPLATAVALCA